MNKQFIITIISFFITQIATSIIYPLIGFHYNLAKDGFKPGLFFFDLVCWIGIFAGSFILLEKVMIKK